MTTLFVSDLHLDDRRPEAIESFLRFLHDDTADAQALYILGDLFEYWLGDDAPTPAGVAVAEVLRQRATAGLPIYFMHGNRDFLLGEDYARRSGIRLLPEEVVVDLYGRPTLLLHGDTLCTDDVAYQEVRSMLRDPVWQAEFLEKSPRERVAFALQAREMSADHKLGVSMDIMDVNPRAVVEAFVRAGVKHMIHGHTHRPAVHTHTLPGATGERIVLGDWYDQGSMLRVDAQGARQIPIPKDV